MLRLQMYLPNALRRGVFDSLPSPPPFNWFFFGKKLFDADLGKSILEIDQPCQLYCSTTGVSYKVVEPSTILISREEDDKYEMRELCEQEEFAGYAYRNRDVPGSMEPPVPCDVIFWVFPDAVTPVSNWKECNILRYAARDPGNSWKEVEELVDRVGIEEASRLFMPENCKKF